MGIYPPSKDSDIMYHIVVIFRENYKVTYMVNSEPSYKATSLCVCLLLSLTLSLFFSFFPCSNYPPGSDLSSITTCQPLRALVVSFVTGDNNHVWQLLL